MCGTLHTPSPCKHARRHSRRIFLPCLLLLFLPSTRFCASWTRAWSSTSTRRSSCSTAIPRRFPPPKPRKPSWTAKMTQNRCPRRVASTASSILWSTPWRRAQMRSPAARSLIRCSFYSSVCLHSPTIPRLGRQCRGLICLNCLGHLHRFRLRFSARSSTSSSPHYRRKRM